MRKEFKKTLALAAVLSMLIVIAALQGCSLFTDSEPVTLDGDPGQSCSVDSECRSNSCIYPGICE